MKLSRIAPAVGFFGSFFAVGVARPLDAADRVQPGIQPGTDSVGCLDTLRASDTISAVVKLTVRSQDRKTALPPDFEGFFAQEFKWRFSPPADLRLSVMQGMGTCDSTWHNCTSGSFWLSSTAYAVARKDGSLSRLGVVDESLTPALAKAVKTALEAMSSERIVPNLLKDQPLEIAIRIETLPDTVPRERQLFKVRLPRYNLPFKGGVPLRVKQPNYPMRAEMARVEDSVSVSYTIMPNGSVNLSSFDFETAQYRDFIQAVIKSIESSTYEPARIGSCPVATWVRQLFLFKAFGT
jgi:hypothetical protein